VKLIGRYFHSGKPATAGSATQVSATSIRPSRVFNSRLKRRVASHNSAPIRKVAPAEMTNDQSAGSSSQIAMTSGASIVTANTIITSANTWATGSSVSFTAARLSQEGG
jgi:hypothetical protein